MSAATRTGLVPLPWLLAEAARDPELAAALLRDRRTALAERGLRLTEAELTLLLAVPDDQLRASAAALAGREPDPSYPPLPAGRTSPTRGHQAQVGCLIIGAVAATGLAVGSFLLCSHGVRPDVPPPRPPEQVQPLPTPTLPPPPPEPGEPPDGGMGGVRPDGGTD